MTKDDYKLVGTNKGVGAKSLGKHWHKLGSFLHMTMPSQKGGGGIGLRPLSTAMAEARSSGIRRFFLGATPAGFRLYERLGFKTVCAARVWVSGETHQA